MSPHIHTTFFRWLTRSVFLIFLIAVSGAGSVAGADTVDWNLGPGFNFVSLGLTPTVITSSQSLMNAQSTVASVFRFNSQTQAFEFQLRLADGTLFGNSFAFESGAGYAVKADATVSVTFTGTAAAADPLSGASPGFIFTAPGTLTGTAASAIIAGQSQVESVFRWDPASSGFKFLLRLGSGTFGDDFTLLAGQGYFIRLGAVPLTTAQADTLVLDNVVKTASLTTNLVVYRYTSEVALGSKVEPATTWGAGDGGLTATENSYLYFIDDLPGAKFAHPVRYCLVGKTSGVTTVSQEQVWPKIGTMPLFTDGAWLADTANQLFRKDDAVVSITLDADTPEDADSYAEPVVAPAPSRAPSRTISVNSDEGIVVVNGWSKGETVGDDMATDAAQMSSFANGHGFKVANVDPPNNGSQALFSAIGNLAGSQGCKDITIYFTGHGNVDVLSLGGEDFTAAQFKAMLSSTLLPEARYKIILDCCYSGSFTGDLNTLDNVEIVITATNGSSSAYGDIDSNTKGVTKADVNDGDAGSEFTSSLLQGLNDLTLDDAWNARVSSGATTNELPYVVNMWLAGYGQSKKYDAARLNGLTQPRARWTWKKNADGVALAVSSDPAGHEPYVGMPASLDLTVITHGNRIVIKGADPFVRVEGTLNADGSFTATGSGTVAGYPGIDAGFTGTFTGGQLTGTYTLGGNGGLPQGQSISYGVQ